MFGVDPEPDEVAQGFVVVTPADERLREGVASIHVMLTPHRTPHRGTALDDVLARLS